MHDIFTFYFYFLTVRLLEWVWYRLRCWHSFSFGGGEGWFCNTSEVTQSRPHTLLNCFVNTKNWLTVTVAQMIVYRQNTINLQLHSERILRVRSWLCYWAAVPHILIAPAYRPLSLQSLNYLINVTSQSGVPNVLCTTQAAPAPLEAWITRLMGLSDSHPSLRFCVTNKGSSR